jgi:hypothetical protein
MPETTRAIALVAAATRTDDELAALFGAVYADYLVPVHLDAIALRTMVRRFDLDLAASLKILDTHYSSFVSNPYLSLSGD